MSDNTGVDIDSSPAAENVSDLDAVLSRTPAPRALGIAGLLGALDAADDLLHADPDELALRDEMTARVLREYLLEQAPPPAVERVLGQAV